MTLNPDNLIFFYLTLAIIALAMSIAIHAAIVGSRNDKPTKRNR